MSIKELRDADGFAIIQRKTDADGVCAPQRSSRIGKYKLIRDHPDDPGFTEKSGARLFVLGTSTGFHTQFKPGSWQYKAWNLIQFNVIWPGKTEFSKIAGNQKLRHVKMVAIMLKAECRVKYKHDPDPDKILFNLATKDELEYPYMCARTPAEFEKLINTWYRCWNKKGKRKYAEMAMDRGYRGVVYVSKIFVIYDDKSYDIFERNPQELVDALGLKFDEYGKVVLKRYER